MIVIKEDDFVIVTKKTRGLEKNAVGFVKAVKGTKASVFFIGVKRRVTLLVSEVQLLDIKKTGKPHKYKICNILSCSQGRL